MFVGNTSRRAAYLTQGWLEDLPTAAQMGGDALRELLAANLARQFRQQGGENAAPLGRMLAETACAIAARRKDGDTALVRDLLAVAEFLAREGRGQEGQP